jgi:hypothetical protein
MTPGEGPPSDNASRRNSFAAVRSRLGDNQAVDSGCANQNSEGQRDEIERAVHAFLSTA